MTERLYYADATLCEFTARVIARQENERGLAVQLDRTAFYPTSGGQPHDRGKLDDVAVLDVWEGEDGEVWHLVERLPLSDEVSGEIDWKRRFDHMQQHSGQHLLSQAFVRLLDAPTVSFHLGSRESHIDLGIPELSWDDAFRVEDEVNRVIWENRPVQIHVVDQEEIHKIPLRRPPKVGGKIRVIWVLDYEASACGGTHVGQTGAVGLLKLTRIERYKGGIRVGFVCGSRALRNYQRSLRGLQEVSAGLSVHPDELGEAIRRLQDESKETRRALKEAQGELMALAADKLWEQTAPIDGVRRVVAHFEDCSFEQARGVAARLSARPRTLALVAVSEVKGTRLVCQRNDDLPEQDAAAVLRSAAEKLGGRGGGTPAQAQGGAPVRTGEMILEALRSAVAG